jgi:hypothetical protein
MQGIKFSHGNINKRVNEKIESYERLIEVVRQLFDNINDIIHIWYLNNAEKQFVNSEEAFRKFASQQKEAVLKLEVSFEKKEFDYVLESVGISESFTIYDKVDNKLREKVFEEKAVQNLLIGESKETETFIETSELATNTVIVNHSEKETQVTHKDKELMLNKIDEVLSSKLKLMEDKFEIMFRRLENSKIYDSKIEDINGYKPNNCKENLILVKPFQDPTFTSFNENDDYFKDEYCSRCKYQIIANKFICMLCVNYKLCSQCERTHTDHPLLKININCKSVKSEDDLINNILSKNNTKEKKGIIKTITSMFHADAHIVNISANNVPLKFALPVGERLVYNIIVQNAGKTRINEPIVISVINNKNFAVKDNNKTIPMLDIYENKELEFFFEAPDEEGVYYLEITAYGGGKKLKVEPVKLEIHVTQKDNCEERNAELFFSDYEEASDLPTDKKVLLYRLVDEKISERDISDIILIMKKHNFDLLSALDELTKSEPEESL